MKSSKIKKSALILFSTVFLIGSFSNFLIAQIGIWTSANELAGIPMSGYAWDAVKNEADAVDPNQATVSNQDSDNNVGILAAGIVYARNGVQSYKDKVVTACERLVQDGHPADRTLAWARETGAYVMAADLVAYRTTAFEEWCFNMAEVWDASDGRTMLEMFFDRPNNWGAHAFGSLCALYRYIGNTTRLNEIRNYWIQSVIGPKPELLTYGDDLSWHVDENNPRRINPQGSVKQGMNIDGIIPDDMRRGGSFSDPPGYTGYPWEYLQGELMAARILDRAGLSIWNVDNNALYRAAYALQIRLENDYGGWKAEGDDEWQLPYWDEAYSTNWSDAYDPATTRIYDHGKNAGWGYVTLGGGTPPEPPAAPSDLVATAVSSSQIDLTWIDNSDNESGFKIEQSDDGGNNFTEIAVVPENDTDFSDTGLSASTQYCYRVRAYNGGGNSDYSNTDCATTEEETPPVDDVANSDIAVLGTVSGNFTNTQASDDSYESITEVLAGGPTLKQMYSALEHKWTINVTGGNVVTFYLEAYHSTNSDGDDFVFSYSTDNVNYTNMVTVTKTSDDNTYQTYNLPSSISGTTYIRVVDTNRKKGKTSLDVIYIDHLFIRSSSGLAKQTIPILHETKIEVSLPTIMKLHQNHPNPFNPRTNIKFDLDRARHVKIVIYDIMGRKVTTMVDDFFNSGSYTVEWEAVDSDGRALPSGIYLCRMQSGFYGETIKISLLQ
jgi:hypothetical protein